MENKDSEKLVAAFKHMVENVSQAIHEAEESLAPTVDEMVQNAQQLAREVYALTQEEAESLGSALNRDIQKANEAIIRQRKELSDWLSFDLTLMEDRFVEMIAIAADKAWLDFRSFETEDHQATPYRSGEICNAGSFVCSNCSEILHQSTADQIPVCSACGNEEFFRVVGE